MSAHPRILIGAPASGCGKTTVTCALLQAFCNRGLNPMACKCGPDYIDPMFHTQVIGAQSRNLDLFFHTPEVARALLARSAARAGITVLEGAMGYYDGIGMGSDASAWDTARVTETPAVLVVDGRGRAVSICAEIAGFLAFRSPSQVAGVIINRVSPMLYPRLKAAIEEHTGLPVFGYLPGMPDCTLNSRHLGLITAGEVENLREKLALLARQAEETLDLDALLALAHSAPELNASPIPLPPPLDAPLRVAIARDAAFCFYYEDSLSILEALGAQLVPFSPLAHSALPPDCAGLYLGGGYPELYAPSLSENTPMRQAIRDAVSSGLPTIAECGGFLYLHRELEDNEGTSWPMVGTIPARGYRTQRLGRFGYVTLYPREDSLLFRRGEPVPAHEFHYWDSQDCGGALDARKPQSSRRWDTGHASSTLYAGFPHLHFASDPRCARRFLAACAHYQERTASNDP